VRPLYKRLLIFALVVEQIFFYLWVGKLFYFLLKNYNSLENTYIYDKYCYNYNAFDFSLINNSYINITKENDYINISGVIYSKKYFCETLLESKRLYLEKILYPISLDYLDLFIIISIIITFYLLYYFTEGNKHS
jgi:hypothetical protein